MLRWIVLLVAGGFLIGIFLPKYDWSAGFSALTTASPWFVSLALIGVISFWLVRATLLWLTLRIKLSFRWFEVYRISSVGSLMDLAIPARGGFFVRWFLLMKRYPAAKGFSFTVLVSVLALEGVVLLFLALLASGVQPGTSHYLIPGLFISVATLFLTLLSAPALLRQMKGTRWERISPLVSVFELAATLRTPSKLILWLALTFLTWSLQASVVILSAKSLDLVLSWNQAIFLLLTINLTLFIPIVPGNLGTMQLVIVWTLTQLNFTGPNVLAFSILFHFVQILPILILGTSLAPGSLMMLAREGVQRARI